MSNVVIVGKDSVNKKLQQILTDDLGNLQIVGKEKDGSTIADRRVERPVFVGGIVNTNNPALNDGNAGIISLGLSFGYAF